MISIRELSKSYGKNQVLQNINLQLMPGMVYGIVGDNGSGKTTLFKCIAGLENYEGKIDSEYEILKNKLGFLPTNPDFMSLITGWEYLKLLCVARNIKEENFEAQNIFQLPLDRYAEKYSTGMKKKLALQGIILQENDVFILDEPFNGVDIQSNFLISEILTALKAKNKTILISSHIFSTLSDNCDEIHLLRGGTLVKKALKNEFALLDQELKNSLTGSQLGRLKIK
jgi:ABC-2 type transport system ATP-binding protein